MTYEEAIKKLEELLAMLESGKLTLEESVKIYEEAVQLSEFCSKTLDAAELKITEIRSKQEAQADADL